MKKTESQINESEKTVKKAEEAKATAVVIPKKQSVKERAAQRLSKLPRIVTKDSNNMDLARAEEPGSAENDVNDYADRRRGVKLESTVYKKNSFKPSRKTPLNTAVENAQRIEPDYHFGLSSEQVSERTNEGYINMVKAKTGKTYRRIFFSNIFTFFNFLIFAVAAALIAVGAGLNQMFFLVIILANISIGIIQEVKSKRAVDKLSLVSAPSATVMRDGNRITIPVTNIVLDDVMCLEMGRQICADSIVIKGEIEVNESMLTGESVPVKKMLGAEVFSGSFVTSGTCYVKVNKVGGANYVETLSEHAKRYKKPQSELHNSIRLIINVIACILIPLTIILLVNNYFNFQGTENMWNKIISQVSGAVIGMIPAGMFLLTSSALAVSIIRLAKKKTLVRDLYCIEMLARVDVLCLDKTGTITDGSMQVNNVVEIKGANTDSHPIPVIMGSMLNATEDNNQTALALADYFGYSKEMKPITVLPFSSQRKLSAVTFEGAGTYMIGAPEFVLKDMGIRIEKIVNEYAANGFRVMVLAHSPADIVADKLPAIRRPICLVVIEDHIREDAVSTVKWFKENSVAVKVISGDNPVTVSEVARRVGVENAELYISLDGLSNQEVIEAANKYTVFGRVTPEQKSLLIKAIKSHGHTVAMTGDGVNDILAMREADCSVAIASGAEAARNVAHLVLQDSSFTSMPDVVMEGRRVVNNIQKASSLFLMKTFMSMVLSILFLLMRKPYPFNTANLLLLEMFVIGVPSFALALQKNTNIIRGKFLSNVIGRSIPGGITLVLSTMAVYLYATRYLGISVTDSANPVYTSLLVMALSFSGIVILFKNCEPFDGFRTVLIICVVVAALVGVVFLPEIFGITKIALTDMLFVSTVVLGSYFVVSGMMKIMRMLKLLN